MNELSDYEATGNFGYSEGYEGRLFSEAVSKFVEALGAHWLVKLIFDLQDSFIENQPFHMITLQVHEQGGGVLTIEDEEHYHLLSKEIDTKSLPVGTFQLWQCDEAEALTFPFEM